MVEIRGPLANFWYRLRVKYLKVEGSMIVDDIEPSTGTVDIDGTIAVDGITLPDIASLSDTPGEYHRDPNGTVVASRYWKMNNITAGTQDTDYIINIMKSGVPRAAIYTDGDDVVISEDLLVKGNAAINEYSRMGTGTAFQAFYMEEGDLYSENGKCFWSNGINTRAELYGIGLQIRESAAVKNLMYSIDATFTAATQIIAKTGETFVSDGVEIGDFLVVTSSTPDLTGGTGEVLLVTETEITVSIAAAGGATLDDLTNVNFVVYNKPIAVFLDNGDIHFTVGSGLNARFHIDCDSADNESTVFLESSANRFLHRAQQINIAANGFGSVAGLRIDYSTGDLAVGASGGGMFIQMDDSEAVNADSTTLLGVYAAATTNSSDASKTAFVSLPGFTNALTVLGADQEDPDYGYQIDDSGATVTDRVNGTPQDGTAFLDSSTSNVTIFNEVDDYILIGSDSTFEIIEAVLETESSHDIETEFYYSKAGNNWTALLIQGDGTSGMQQSGDIIFAAPGDWTKDDQAIANGDITDAYYVKIVRTRTGIIPTLPIENYLKTFPAQATGMNIDGGGFIQPRSAVDASAPNNSIYYSETQSALVYKDSGGTPNVLY